mgnify:CR=1 FL=1
MNCLFIALHFLFGFLLIYSSLIKSLNIEPITTQKRFYVRVITCLAHNDIQPPVLPNCY